MADHSLISSQQEVHLPQAAIMGPSVRGFSSPIAGRQAWSGNSGGFITTTVNLPAAAQGQNVVFRWRRATDSSSSGAGAWIDDVYTTPNPTRPQQ
jgi:hypothetical protein